ncbi:hypothetical protein MYP_3255 [Sporocytophaga myxococcoides]|uniref:Reverse transcriptase domain-containing protein n=1 Tax=Sporocytophaga myxococcoides TaxID=153721 RepID=A0A098LGB9_9BACT|nr:hypothetical protein [Sporocytophaga myxococcoides]GAL86026.1 hypothetical protein MYP_3255 [Sporocytophaga myxococcoides]
MYYYYNYIPSTVEDAFRKLQSYIYFESTDLYLRNQLAEFISDGKIDEKLDSISKKLSENEGTFKYSDIKLRYYPKKVSNSFKKIDSAYIPPNFYTNQIFTDNAEVENIAVFADVPMELQIIAVLWILKYGFVLDKNLSKHCYGNRLILPTNEFSGQGRSLFKPYIKQYQKWWSNGLREAKELLDKGEDVTIITFDFKDYFHSVELNFSVLEKELSELHNDFDPNDIIHKVFRKIHEEYKKCLREIDHPSASLSMEDVVPLPISLLSSFILGNWHLKKFDKEILDKLNPVYYGRYVDDNIVVIRDSVIKEFNKEHIEDLRQNFIKEYAFFEDIREEKKINILMYFIFKYLDKIFVPAVDAKVKDNLKFHLLQNGLSNIFLQNEKLFIYQFNAEHSPNLINKFIEEQKERSSEFRFLSDDADESFSDFEENTFESNFETIDVNKARFKSLEDNKFKLSVFFAKLIKRKILNGKDYKNDELNKIQKYFQGIYSIKHYYFWEKLFTLYVVSNDHEKFSKLLITIINQLEKIQIKSQINISREKLIGSLNKHLIYSLEMSLGLNPRFLTKKILKIVEEKITHNLNIRKFRNSHLLRKQYIYYPLIQFTQSIKDDQSSLFDPNFFNSRDWKEKDFLIINKSYIPYRVKFYETCLFTFYQTIYLKTIHQNLNNKRWLNDILNSEKYLNDSFDLFYRINISTFSQDKEVVRDKYFKLGNLDSFEEIKHDTEGRVKDNYKNFETSEIYLQNGSKELKTCRIGLVNLYVDFVNYEKSLDGKPNLSSDRIELYSSILDKVNEIKDIDLFVQPELSLPHALLYTYIKNCANKQIGLVSGVEHLKAKNVGYNFVLTSLPINVFGDKDAIPIIRLKNHYAPEEEEWIRGKKMVVPKPNPYRYDLFVWRNVYFATYYCYELADVFHRMAFYSKIDFICAPVWNVDTHYYNSIVESASRELHCYFIKVNTSQYGETRVTRPTNIDRRDKVRVKGGTVDDYKVAVLVADLDIEKLRKFQKLEYSAQKDLNKDKKWFKPTPPDFPVESVWIRDNKKMFSEKRNED